MQELERRFARWQRGIAQRRRVNAAVEAEEQADKFKEKETL